jgi:hypothetical protein
MDGRRPHDGVSETQNFPVPLIEITAWLSGVLPEKYRFGHFA